MFKFKENKGFTVVELLVAVGLFTTIITIAIGAYIRVLRTQSFMTDIMSANDNVSLVIEQMSREIRTGSQVAVNNGALRLENDEGVCVQYDLHYDSSEDNSFIRKSESNSAVCSDNVYSNYQYLTSKNVSINDLVFDMVSSNGFQRVQIDIEVNVRDISGEGDFFTEGNHLKTFVSTRQYFSR